MDEKVREENKTDNTNLRKTDAAKNALLQMRNDGLEPVKQTVRRIFSITEDAASHEEIRDRLLSGGKVTGTNMCVMICAILIASVGLILLRIPKVKEMTQAQWKRMRRRMIRNTILIVLPSIAISIVMVITQNA